MNDRTRIAKLERDVARLEGALIVVAQEDDKWRYRHPRSGPLGTIWKRVQKRSRGE